MSHRNGALCFSLFFILLGPCLPTASATWVSTFDTGVQLDYLRWNISATDGRPNILSELTFKTLSPMGRLNVRWFSEDSPWSFSGEYGFGKIVDGSVKDEDFASSNRQDLFSRSTHDANDHNVQTGNFRIGYRLVNTPHFQFSPTLGFQWQYSRIKIEDGRQKVPDVNVDFSNLNSTYSARWLALSLGGRWEYDPRTIPWIFSMNTNFFPFAFYDGIGHWNLRSDFSQSPSFEHRSRGYGGQP